MTFRRVLFYTTLLIVALVVGTYFALTRSGLARSLILDSLSRVFAGRLQLEDAELDPIEGTVRLENLRLTPKSEDGKGRKEVLEVPEMVVGVSMNPLSGAGEVRTLLIERAELDLYLGDETPVDLASLLKLDGAPSGDRIPSVRVKDMTVRLHLPAEKDLELVLAPIQLRVRPEKDNPRRLVLDGECPNPMGGTIRIRGHGDLDKQEFRLLAEAEEFVLQADGVQAFGEAVARFVELRRLEGRVKPTLWIAYPGPEGGLDGGIRSTFADFQVLPPTFTYLLTHLEGSASFTLQQGGTLAFRVDRSGTDLEVAGTLRVSNLEGRDEVELRAEAWGVQINRKLELALASIPAARSVYAAFKPRNGRADAKVYVHSGIPPAKEADGPVPHTQLDVTLRDLDIEFSGFPRGDGERPVAFPYPATLGTAEIEVRDDFVTIRSFRARAMHGGDLSGDGEIDLARDQMDLRIHAEEVPFSNHLRRALGTATEEGGEIYDRFQPAGELDFDLRVLRRPEMASTAFQIDLHPRGASATWGTLPYRVDNLVGDVRITADQVRFQLRGNRGPETALEARARFLHLDDPTRATTEIRVEAKRATLDEELREALGELNPAFLEHWDLFSPRGRFDLEFLAWKPPGSDELSFDLRADVEDGRAVFTQFPASLRDLRGPLILHGDGPRMRAEILGLTGRGLEARLMFRGAMEFGESADPKADLTVAAKGVRLSDELLDVLADRGFVTPEFWKLTKASGTVDAILEIRRDPGDEKDPDWRQELTVDLRQVTCEADLLPDKLTRMSGEVRIDNDHVIHLRDLRGRLGESPITCTEGRIWQEDGDTHLRVELSASRYPIDARLANLLDGDVKQAYLERNARGEVSLEGLDMTIVVPKVPPPDAKGLGVRARFHGGEFRAHALALDVGIRVTDVGGSVLLDEGHFDHEGASFAGTLRGLSFVALGQTFNDARGPFRATHEYLTIPSGKVEFHGGKVLSFSPVGEIDVEEPVVRLDFGDRRRLETNLDISQVRVESLIGGMQTLQRYKGRLNGQVRLALDTVDPTTLQMKASFGIEDGYLGDVPIFRSIYSLLRPEKRPNFDSGLLVLRAKDRTLFIDRMLVKSPVMRVEGKGTLGFDGYLRLEIDFPDLFPEASPITILPGIYRALANSLVAYDVHGYIGNLRTGARFLPFEGGPKRLPLAPIPGRPVRVRPIFR